MRNERQKLTRHCYFLDILLFSNPNCLFSKHVQIHYVTATTLAATKREADQLRRTNRDRRVFEYRPAKQMRPLQDNERYRQVPMELYQSGPREFPDQNREVKVVRGSFLLNILLLLNDQRLLSFIFDIFLRRCRAGTIHCNSLSSGPPWRRGFEVDRPFETATGSSKL